MSIYMSMDTYTCCPYAHVDAPVDTHVFRYIVRDGVKIPYQKNVCVADKMCTDANRACKYAWASTCGTHAPASCSTCTKTPTPPIEKVTLPKLNGAEEAVVSREVWKKTAEAWSSVGPHFSVSKLMFMCHGLSIGRSAINANHHRQMPSCLAGQHALLTIMPKTPSLTGARNHGGAQEGKV